MTSEDAKFKSILSEKSSQDAEFKSILSELNLPSKPVVEASKSSGQEKLEALFPVHTPATPIESKVAQKVFIAIESYSNGDYEDIKLFANRRLARKWVFERIQRYYKGLPTLAEEIACSDDEENPCPDHSAEWRLGVLEGIIAVEKEPGAFTDLVSETFKDLLDSFHAFGAQGHHFFISEEEVIEEE